MRKIKENLFWVFAYVRLILDDTCYLRERRQIRCGRDCRGDERLKLIEAYLSIHAPCDFMEALLNIYPIQLSVPAKILVPLPRNVGPFG
ncbi:hypothetical protein [[Eubacterium] cellulosolvens]